METRFPHIASQESLDRLAALDRRKRAEDAAARLRSIRSFLGWSSLLVGQIVLIILVASEHPAWPF